MTTYQVKSSTGKFKPFQISDDGLGYLQFNIFEKITWTRDPLSDRKIDKDIRVRVKGNPNAPWMKFRNKRQSSVSYLVPA